MHPLPHACHEEEEDFQQTLELLTWESSDGEKSEIVQNSEEEEEEISMLNIRMSRTPIDGAFKLKTVVGTPRLLPGVISGYPNVHPPACE